MKEEKESFEDMFYRNLLSNLFISLLFGACAFFKLNQELTILESLLVVLCGYIFLGVWGYAVYKWGFLVGLTVGWFPAGIASGLFATLSVIFYTITR